MLLWWCWDVIIVRRTQCTQSHKERIRMTLWPEQAEKLLSSISAVENRTHSWYVVVAFSGKALPILAHLSCQCYPCPGKRPCPRAKARRWHHLLTWQESSRLNPASSKKEAGSRYWYQLAAWNGVITGQALFNLTANRQALSFGRNHRQTDLMGAQRSGGREHYGFPSSYEQCIL